MTTAGIGAVNANAADEEVTIVEAMPMTMLPIAASVREPADIAPVEISAGKATIAA
jgi:hypothetical protein